MSLGRAHRLVRRGRRIVGAGGQHRRARWVGVAGERALVGSIVVLERDLDPDRLAIVGVNQRVSAGRRARNVGVGPARHPDPLEAGVGVRQQGDRLAVQIRDGAHRRRQHLAHPRGTRDPRLARRRVVHRRHIDSHRIRRHTVVRAIVHPEGETRQGDPAFVRRGAVFQGADLGRGHRLRQVPRRNRRARERERALARCRQRHDLHARETAGIRRIYEGKVGAGEGVVRVLGRDHRLVRRGRRVVHRRHIDSHRIRRRTVGRAVVHPEGECNPKVAVRHGGVFQVAGGELGRGHRLRQVPRRNRRARKRERARRRQRYDLHALERSARIRIREGKVGAGEGVLRVLVRDHHLVRRGRHSVGGGAGGGIDDVGGSGAGADAVDGRDAVVAGGAGGQPGVLVGGGGAGGVGDQVGPGSTAIDGDLDLVAGDDTAAVVDRSGPREVDRVGPAGGCREARRGVRGDGRHGGVVGDGGDAVHAGGEGRGVVAGGVLDGQGVVAGGGVGVGDDDGLALADSDGLKRERE